jgi:hypothetical protein
MNISEIPSTGTGMSNATAPPDDRPEKLRQVTELRNQLLQITGPGRGAEVQAILDKLKALHGQPEAAPLKPKDPEELVRKFLRRPPREDVN